MSRTTARPQATAQALRDVQAVADLFVNVFRRDLIGFYPLCRFEPVDPGPSPSARFPRARGPDFLRSSRAKAATRSRSSAAVTPSARATAAGSRRTSGG